MLGISDFSHPLDQEYQNMQVSLEGYAMEGFVPVFVKNSWRSLVNKVTGRFKEAESVLRGNIDDQSHGALLVQGHHQFHMPQHIHYMDIAHVTIPVPTGLNGYYKDYLLYFLNLTNLIEEIPYKLVQPTEDLIGKCINDPTMLAVNSGVFSLIPSKHYLDEMKKANDHLAKLHTSGSNEGTREFSKTFRNMGEYAECGKLIRLLVEALKALDNKQLIDKLTDLDHMCTTLVDDILSPHNNVKISPVSAKGLSELIYATAQAATWIGTFEHTLNTAIVNMLNIEEQVNKLDTH